MEALIERCRRALWEEILPQAAAGGAGSEGQALWLLSFAGGEWLQVAAQRAQALLDASVSPGGEQRLCGELERACGLAEYGRSAGEQDFLHLAREMGLHCLQVYDRPEYGGRFLPEWCLVLRLATALLGQGDDRQMRIAGARAVAAILNHHYQPDVGLLVDALGHDFFPLGDERGPYVHSARALAALDAVLEEARRTGEDRLFALASRYVQEHLEKAWDGALVRREWSGGQWSGDREPALQAEALAVALLAGGTWAGRLAECALEALAKPDLRSGRALALVLARLTDGSLS